MNNAFIGMNGYVWWVGVIEDRKDPLNLGRCRIRIFGWHTDDKTLIPTQDLPWAQPVLPVNNSKSFTTPPEGSWVTGFFFDGQTGQFPVYTGVLPGIPTPYTNNPQKGFTDPRSASDLAAAPAPPKKVDAPSDGGGSEVTNQPAQRNPINPGQPSTSPLAVNSADNPPASIAQRMADKTTNIAGPAAKSLGTAIAGAAQGAAAALGGAQAQLTSLVPSADALAAQIKPPAITMPSLPSLGSLTGQPQSAAATNTSAISAAAAQAQSILAKSQAAVQSQLADAQKAAADAAAKAQAAASQSLDDLNAKASSIADTIASKLSALAPADVPTVTPVNLQNAENPVAVLSATAPAPLVNTLAPNKIPDEVPLEKVGSTTQKSVENCIALNKEYLTRLYTNILSAMQSATTLDQYNATIMPYLQKWVDAKGRGNTIAALADDPDATLKDLTDFRQPLADKLNAENKVNRARLGAST